jgi:S-formylglutathione hydrolase FrmB
MIVVAPNAWNAYKGSHYVNSVVTGNWEDYIFQDVVNYVDENYRTLARAASRGIAGHSMGGFGAIYVGMKHADMFSAVYALAPSRLSSFGPISSDGIKDLDSQWEGIMTRMLQLTSKEQLPLVTRESREDSALNGYLAWFAAFSPNPNRPPLYADFAYEDRNGNLVKNQAVFEKAKENIPIFMIDKYKENLHSLRGLIMDYGELDGNLPTGAQFARALADRSIPHTLEIYAGGDHTNMIRDRLETRVFPFFSDLLDFSQQ